ncbi:hypothetical protein BDV98DRAFT_575007 [Pterulicium gracile]|uniref:Secreted protein n=1 Tax=Pterulicium gracile TaxID=1884261 RepID=A0A5C3Q4Y8_9AGAR|nr:hypothetical protein BDV98DRAFT_575007 [Pterula gracilis]
MSYRRLFLRLCKLMVLLVWTGSRMASGQCPLRILKFLSLHLPFAAFHCSLPNDSRRQDLESWSFVEFGIQGHTALRRQKPHEAKATCRRLFQKTRVVVIEVGSLFSMATKVDLRVES